MKCEFCGYKWKPRKKTPVSCPRCKKRFDFPSQTTSPPDQTNSPQPTPVQPTPGQSRPTHK